MPYTLTMPKLSPTMEQGTLVKWHKKEGEYVEAGDLIIEVATDKATVEHHALDNGWLRKIIVQENSEAVVNQAIAIFTEDKNESIENYQPEGAKPALKSNESASKTENNTAMQEVKPEPASRPAASLRQPAFSPEPPLEGYSFEFPTEAIENRIKASPLARKTAKEKGLDISTVKGTGPGGRIVNNDLELAQPLGKVSSGRRQIPSILPGFYEEEALTPMRKVIGQRLQDAKSSIPHFYVTVVIDAVPLTQFREQLSQWDLKVSYNDCVIRACAIALNTHQGINSGFNSTNNTIIRFKTIDIAVAVSIPDGLITPVIRHANYKNINELSVEMKSLIKKARDGKLQPSEYKGGSFTISNLGMFGVQEFQAILNPPQAAIIAVSGILDVPVIKNGNIVAGKTMSLTLSVDHRVIDGVAAAEFLNSVKKLLENPAGLLL